MIADYFFGFLSCLLLIIAAITTFIGIKSYRLYEIEIKNNLLEKDKESFGRSIKRAFKETFQI